MRRLALVLLLACSPAVAQDAEEERNPITRNVEDFLRNLFSDVEPQLRELRDAIGNLNDYESPEMLPNGDIIIRRKTPLDPEERPEPGPEAGEDGAIDL